jgi:hypothetical protein
VLDNIKEIIAWVGEGSKEPEEMKAGGRMEGWKIGRMEETTTGILVNCEIGGRGNQ